MTHTQTAPSAYDRRVTDPHSFRYDCPLCMLPSCDEESLCEILTRKPYVPSRRDKFRSLYFAHRETLAELAKVSLFVVMGLLVAALVVIPSAVVISTLPTLAAQYSGVALAGFATVATLVGYGSIVFRAATR